MSFVRALSFAAAALVFASCGEEPLAPPPLFNALDPSQQCEAGKVGWDFTTGGNAGAVIPAKVGSEIRVTKAQYYCKGDYSTPDAGSNRRIDLLTNYRRECDNHSRCVRPILRTAGGADGGVAETDTLKCTEREAYIQYKCGTEDKTYTLSRTYPANATAANTFNQKVPDTKPSDVVTLSCGSPMYFVGYSFQYDNGTFSQILNDRGTSECNGLRGCFSNSKAPWTSNYGSTGYTNVKWYYRCGLQNPTVFTFTASPGKMLNVSCDDASAEASEPAPVIYLRAVTQDTPSATQQAQVDEIFNGLKASCQGQRSCDYNGPALPSSFGNFSVEYWCGTSQQRAEKKYVHLGRYTNDPAAKQKIHLQCGGRLTITDATQPWVKTECPTGARLCSIPPSKADATITYFCDGLWSSLNHTLKLSAPYSATKPEQHDLECPLETERSGIELVERCFSTGTCGTAPDISEVNLCQNQQSCAIPKGTSTWSKYNFKCSGTNETKSSVQFTANGKSYYYLDCKPKPVVTGVSGCVTLPSTALKCETVNESGCTVPLQSTTNTAATIAACTQKVTVNYNCGNTASTASLTPTATDAGYKVTVDCPYDPTPRTATSTKACVPATCPANSTRTNSLDCQTDSTISTFSSFEARAVFKELDAGVPTTTLKEGYPYVLQAKITYPGTPRLTSDSAAVIWAYDVYKKKSGAAGAEVKALRCIVGGGSISAHESNTVAVTNGRGGVLPPECFREYPVGSWKGSWYNGSRVAGLNEVTFRDQYQRAATNVVVSFDVKGRANRTSRGAPNPIGFFYDRATSYINQYDFYAQTADFTNQANNVTFQPTNRIDLVPLRVEADQATIRVGGTQKPTMDFNFAWKLLGESPANGFAQQPSTAAFGSPLYSKHPRAVVEIAKFRQGVPNLWTADNTGAFPAVPLGNGNALEAVERLTFRVPQYLVNRMLSVKKAGATTPNGWMDNNIEVNSVFQARVCMDIDGLSHVPGDGALDNQWLSRMVDTATYEIGFSRRCTPAVTFAVVRDLFKTPTVPLRTQEGGIDQANTTDQGGDEVSSANDNGTQADCRTPCTANADCGAGGTCVQQSGTSSKFCARNTTKVTCKSTYRSGTANEGEMGRSMFSMSSSNTTERGVSEPEVHTENRIELVSFNVLDAVSGDKSTTGVDTANRIEINISLGRIWSSVAAISELVGDLSGEVNPEPVKPWWKPSLSTPFSGGDSVPGIAFGISAGTVLLLGPFPIQVEVSAGVSLGFDVSVHFLSDYQTTTKNNSPQYPCLGTSKCVTLESTPATFKDAAEDCLYKGGRLKELRTATDLSDTKTAAAGVPVWVGGYGSHIFDDPTCADLSTVPQADAGIVAATCRANSLTQYFWLGDGGTSFATSYPSGQLFNTNLFTATHPFGAALTSIFNPEGAPIATGVLLAPDGGLQAWRATNELSTGVTVGSAAHTAQYVCEYDPAGRYDYMEISVTPGIEFSVGVSASACVPSDIIGLCATASFEFINAGLELEIGLTRMNVYTNDGDVEPRAKLGTNTVDVNWNVAFLTGGLAFELHYLIGEDSWDIVSYDGVASFSGSLYSSETRFRKP